MFFFYTLQMRWKPREPQILVQSIQCDAEKKKKKKKPGQPTNAFPLVWLSFPGLSTDRWRRECLWTPLDKHTTHQRNKTRDVDRAKSPLVSTKHIQNSVQWSRNIGEWRWNLATILTVFELLLLGKQQMAEVKKEKKIMYFYNDNPYSRYTHKINQSNQFFNKLLCL